jgi:Holliday junction resolvase
MMKKRINSKQKGNRGEREWSNLCKDHGYNTRRSQQYAGGTQESADVVGLPYIHQEVKNGYACTIEEIREFLRQAIEDAAKSRKVHELLIPIVAHKKTYGKWFVSMETTDFVDMYTTAIGENIIPKVLTNNITYVTLPEDDWFQIYREFEASMSIDKGA